MASSKKHFRKKLFALFFIAIAVKVASLAALRSGVFERFENALWDRRLSVVASHVKPDPKIKIITIDQSSLDFFAREEKIYWPWPRALYEPVLKFLKEGGARAVAFDILFTEPSSYGVDDDETFAQALKDGPPVVISATLRPELNREGDKQQWLAFKKFQLRHNGPTRRDFLFETGIETFRSALVPITQAIESSTAIGNVSARPDLDGIFRHATPGGVVNGVPVLSLPFALYDISHPSLISETRATELAKRDGHLAVRFAGGARTYSTTPIAAVIQSYSHIADGQPPQLDPSEFKDALVFVGMDAPGLLDLRPIPLAEVFPGVEFNATVLDNLVHDTFFYQLSAGQGVALAIVFALALSATALFVSRLRYQLIILTTLIGLFVWICFQAAIAEVWIPMAVPLVTGFASLLYCFVYQFQLEGREHRFLRHAFRHYVSSDVVSQIVENPASLAIGGEKRELTIFFSDIEGFTKISEKLEVGRLVELLNQFFTEMSGIIMAHGGTVDKYVGDAIVAFWNAPLPCADHAERGVRAAIECQKKLAELRVGFEARFGVVVRMRVGINSGIVNVGNFGSKDRFNYTMIGDAANLASRLEGANKHFGTYLMVSEDTRTAVGDTIPMRKIAEILVVGKQVLTVVYEPLGTIESVLVKRFEQGLEKLDAGNTDEALRIMRELVDDPVAQRYAKHLENGRGRIFALNEK